MLFSSPPLMALAAACLLAVVLSWLGVFVVMKRMSFIADGIAHASLAGVALGVLLRANPLYTALLFSLGVGAIIFCLERYTNLPVDTIITLLFTTSLAVGILLMSRQGEELEALEAVLFGDVTSLTAGDLAVVIPLTVGLGLLLGAIYQRLALLVFDRSTAYVAGVPVDRLQLTFYLMLVSAIVLGIKFFGVLLVSALTVIPASAAKLVSRSFHGALGLSSAFAVLIILAGLPLAAVFRLPPGAMVVISGVILFTFAMGVHRFAYGRRR